MFAQAPVDADLFRRHAQIFANARIMGTSKK
jgi:hypothetical protein